MVRKGSYINIVIFFLSLFIFSDFQIINAQGIADWEDRMLEFERLDQKHNYSEDSIFFTGSSSIQLWQTLEEDMAPYSVIPRGISGSKMPDLLHYADRYIKPHLFMAMVLFVANDIVGDEQADKTPEQVQALFEEFILKVKEYNPELYLFIVEITPTNNRWDAWPEIHSANKLIARLSDDYQNVVFIPAQDLFLKSDNTPDDELFLSDQLHLNDKGYEAWTKRIRSYLDPVLLNR